MTMTSLDGIKWWHSERTQKFCPFMHSTKHFHRFYFSLSLHLPVYVSRPPCGSWQTSAGSWCEVTGSLLVAYGHTSLQENPSQMRPHTLTSTHTHTQIDKTVGILSGNVHNFKYTHNLGVKVCEIKENQKLSHVTPHLCDPEDHLE